MADKKITDLQPIAVVTDTLNLPGDNGIMTFRATALQLKAYILAAGNVVRSMITPAERVPIGGVFPFAGTTAPTGYLLCDGSAISRTTYAALFAEIGTAFGAGDGSTTFNVPDTRGIFIRGAGSQTISGTSYAGTLATKQGQLTKLPTTAFGFTTGVESSSHTHGITAEPSTTGTTYVAGRGSGVPQTSYSTGTQSANHTHSAASWSGGDAETRPGNIALNHIVKY